MYLWCFLLVFMSGPYARLGILSQYFSIAIFSDRKIYIPPVLSTCPLHTNSGCGKERRILIGPWWPAKAALVRNYLEVYWPCAGGLLVVNAIGKQLRDPKNLGLTRWRMAVHKWTSPRNSGGIPWVSTRFSLSMEMSRLTRDGTAEPVSQDQIIRHARGQGNFHFPCSADHGQDWQPYPVDPYSTIYVMTMHIYTYILHRL